MLLETMAGAAALIKQFIPFGNGCRVSGDHARIQRFFGIAGDEIKKNTNEN